MDYLQNHIWCSDSNWGGLYSCRHWVCFTSYQDHELNDWESLIDDEVDEYFNQREYEVRKKHDPSPDKSDEELIEYCTHLAPNLKPHVLQWLHTNVEDRPQQKTSEGESLKGWCIGSPKYRGINESAFTVFFYRKKDAMKFIKEFSEYKKPVIYCQKFSDVRKKLDLNTRKYTIF